MFGMDSFEFNKIAGALLGSLLFLMGLGIVADVIFAGPAKIVAGYALPAGEDKPAAAATAAAPAEPLPVLLAKADAAKGQAQAKVCLTCHALEKGGANKIGPGLWGVVGHKMGSHEGFNYSAGFKERAAKGETWTFENLNKFLENPKGFIPGTLMTFNGLKEADKRADLLAYLRTISDSPVELPKP
jgi:cytochrome c